MLPFRVAKHLVFHSHRSRNPLFQRGLNFAPLRVGPHTCAQYRTHARPRETCGLPFCAHVRPRCVSCRRTTSVWPPALHTHTPSTGPGHADKCTPITHQVARSWPPTKRVRFATYPQRWPGPNVWSPISKRADLVDAQHSSVATFSWQSNPMTWPDVVVAQSVSFGRPTAGVCGHPSSPALAVHVSCVSVHPLRWASTCDHVGLHPVRVAIHVCCLGDHSRPSVLRGRPTCSRGSPRRVCGSP